MKFESIFEIDVRSWTIPIAINFTWLSGFPALLILIRFLCFDLEIWVEAQQCGRELSENKRG